MGDVLMILVLVALMFLVANLIVFALSLKVYTEICKHKILAPRGM